MNLLGAACIVKRVHWSSDYSISELPLPGDRPRVAVGVLVLEVRPERVERRGRQRLATDVAVGAAVLACDGAGEVVGSATPW